MKTPNIFQIENVPSASENEIIEKLHDVSANLLIERIVSTGQVSPEDYWYDQPTNEWVVLLQGNATIEFENAEMTYLEKGNYLFIPAHQKHRVVFTSSTPPCIWLTVHYK